MFKFLIYFTLFLLTIFPTTDTDLGFHLRYGEYILTHFKLINHDIFSWTLPGYNWFNFSWLFDVYSFFVYSRMGFVGLSLSAGIIMVLTYYFLIKPYKLSFPLQVLSLFTFVFIIQPILGPGLRSQLINLWGLSLELYLIYLWNKGNFKAIFLAPLIILVWFNLHGSFILGLIFITLFVATEVLNDYLYKASRKRIIWLLMVLFLCVFVIILQSISYDILNQLLQYLPQNMPSGVNEWLPVAVISDTWLFLFFWTILVGIILFKKRKDPSGLFKSAYSLAFAYWAFKSRRMIGPYYIVTFPLFLEVFQAHKFKYYPKAVHIICLIFLITATINTLFVKIPKFKYFNFSWTDYCEMGKRCSMGAAQYLNKRPLPDKSFTFYNYGGFTIWNNRKSKVFVDGRMHLWNKNGYSPYIDHNKIIYDGNLELFDKYQFDAAYIPTTTRLAGYLTRKSAQGLWKAVYEDEISSIFIRVKK